MKRLSIVYQPKFKASEFVVQGVDLPGIERIPLEHRENALLYALYGLFLFLRIYTLAFYFRYTGATRKRLKAAADTILFWDSCTFNDYLMVHRVCGADRKEYVFLWNPLSRWICDEGLIRKGLEILKGKGFGFRTFDFDDAQRFGIPLVKNVNRFMPELASQENQWDFYFVGKAKQRKGKLLALEKELQNRGFSTHFLLIEKKEDYISNKENLLFSSRAKCIVDLVDEKQTGLTLRPFDALFLGKKLLTNNRKIKETDFYDPANIFVIENENLDGLEKFMGTPYKKIDEALILPYEVNHWTQDNFLN